MLLTCPNCGAEYEVAEGMIPAAGRHVQCTTCHTRWFVAGAPRATLTEEQVLHRLEGWSQRPRPTVVPTPAEAPPAEAPPHQGPAVPEAPAPPAEAASVVPIRRAAPAKPGAVPTVARPAEVTGPPAPVRQALRLDVRDSAPAPAVPPSRSRFGLGLLVALVIAAVGFLAYLRQTELAAAVPAAAPALAAYGAAVDDLRDAIEADVVAPVREALAP